MSTLTATPLPGLAAVQLTAAGLPAGPAVITRTDANGSTPVRLLPAQEPIAGSLIVTDYEPALTGVVRYTVDDAAAEVALEVPFPVLAAAGRPNLRAHLTGVTDYTESTAGAAAVYVLDRDDPIIFDEPHRLPSGSLVVWCATYADAVTVARVARAGRTLLFRQADHAGMDRFVKVTATNVAPRDAGTATRRWQTRLDTLDVAPPSTPLLSAAGWDFTTLAGTVASFTELKAAFATFNAVTVGP